MSEIAQLSCNNSADFDQIMGTVGSRLIGIEGNEVSILKTLALLDYCIHEGSERCVIWAQEKLFAIRILRKFDPTDAKSVTVEGMYKKRQNMSILAANVMLQ